MPDNTLEAIITAQTDQFVASLQDVTDAVDKTAQSIQTGFAEASATSERSSHEAADANASLAESFNSVRESITHIAEVVGVFEAFNKIREAANGALEFGETMHNMSLQLGVSTDRLQEMKFAADATGVSFEGLTRFAQQLARASIQMQTGGGGGARASVLEAAGIDPAQMRDASSAIEAISARMKVLGADSELIRNVMVEFGGRGGLAFLPMIEKIDELSEKAREMGAIIPPDALNSLDEAKEKFNILGAIVEADKEKLTAALVPILTVVVNLLTQGAEKINEWASNGALQQWAYQAADAFLVWSEQIVKDEAAVEDFVRNAISGLGELTDWFTTLYNGIEKIVGILNTVNNVLGAQADAIHNFGASIINFLNPFSALTGNLVNQKQDFGPKAAAGGGPEDHIATAAEKATERIKVLEATRAELAGQMAGSIKPSQSQMFGGGLTPDEGVERKAPPPAKLPEAAAQKKAAATAAKTAATDELQAYAASQQVEAEIAGDTAAAKVRAATNVYNEAVRLFGAQSKQAEAAYAKELTAQRGAKTEGLAEYTEAQQVEAQLAGGTAAAKLTAATNVYNQTVALYGEQSKQAEKAYIGELSAQRAANTEKFNAYKQEQEQEVVIAGSTATAKLAAAQLDTNEAIRLFGAQSKEAEGAQIKEIQAARAAQTELNAINSQKAQDATSNNTLVIESQKGQLAQQLATGQISKQQELQGEANVVNQILAIREAMYAKLAAMPGQTEQQIEGYQQKEVQAHLQAAAQIQQIQLQATQTWEAGWQSAANIVSGATDQFVNGMIQGNLNLKSVMQGLFIQMVDGMIAEIFRLTAVWLSQTAIMQAAGATLGLAGAGGIFGGVAGGAGGVAGAGASVAGAASGVGAAAPQITAITANTTALIANTTAMTAQTAASGVAAGAGAAGAAGATAAASAATGIAAAPQITLLTTLNALVTTMTTTLNGQLILTNAALVTANSFLAIISAFAPIAASPSVLGFSLAGGGIIPSAAGGMVGGGTGGSLAILHPKEMVLPANISENIQKTLGDRGQGGGAVPAAAATMQKGGMAPATLNLPAPQQLAMPARTAEASQRTIGGQGDDRSSGSGPSVSVSYGNISAIDSGGVKNVLSQHADHISKIVGDQYKSYGRGYSGR